jgi:hypothetical protein
MALTDRLREILKRQRRYASFFEWPDKQRKELGVVEQLLKAMEVSGESVYRSPTSGPSANHAPDCIAYDLSGEAVAMEVRELVSEEAIQRNQKEDQWVKWVYRDWQPKEVVEEVSRILREKDAKEYHGGPYVKIAVVIYTDEMTISYNSCAELLRSNVFGPFEQVSEAFLLFPYGSGSCPYVRLQLPDNVRRGKGD